MNPVIKVRRLSATAQIPAYQSEHAAGMDLHADLSAPLFMAPGERRAVGTGLAIEIPPGFEGQVRPRSGRALREGLSMINAPGTIDADYRGELQVLLANLGDREVEIRPGDRIAQLIIAPVARAELVESSELGDSRRGFGGFGHTGR